MNDTRMPPPKLNSCAIKDTRANRAQFTVLAHTCGVASTQAEQVTIAVNETVQISGLIQLPARARWCFVLAHGAGAGMRHPFMAAVADGLADLGIASLRYQFPFAERRARRPDSPRISHETVRAAVAKAAQLAPRLPLIAGGKSFGGRMTSQAQASSALPAVRGLAFLGFPLHPPEQPSIQRAEHLFQVQVPMLLLQGTRDAFAQLQLLEPLVQSLGTRSTLNLVVDADHSFRVPARSGRSDSDARAAMLQALADWADSLLARP
jgi:predicted alpha/beta-hydrolase family hydrolase